MFKSLLIIIILFASSINNCSACEICGCGNSNFQIGILPNFTKGFVGLRYSASTYNSVIRTDATQYSHDQYKTLELWGGYNFNKIQIMAFMPYVVSRKESDDGVTTSRGAGDLLVLVNYKLVSSTALNRSETITVRNDIYIGGGIKLPTGLNRVEINNPDFNIGDFNSQAGTGSVDYLMNLTHNIMWNRSGIVTNLAYRINTANRQDYRFGNRTYISTAYFYTLSKSETKIKPSAGFNFQSNAINTYAGSEVDDSNGYTLSGTLGVNVIHGKAGFNAMGFLPLTQNMYDGQTKMQTRFLLGVTYSF